MRVVFLVYKPARRHLDIFQGTQHCEHTEQYFFVPTFRVGTQFPRSGPKTLPRPMAPNFGRVKMFVSLPTQKKILKRKTEKLTKQFLIMFDIVWWIFFPWLLNW